MKLKCDQHARRVLTIPGSSIFHHRTGDMSKCDSKTASLQDNTSRTTRSFTVDTGDLIQLSTNKEYGPRTDRTKTPAENLLHEIFENPNN